VAHAFPWEYSYKKRKLAQLLAELTSLELPNHRGMQTGWPKLAPQALAPSARGDRPRSAHRALEAQLALQHIKEAASAVAVLDQRRGGRAHPCCPSPRSYAIPIGIIYINANGTRLNGSPAPS
jgi:hypothetical protein